MRIFSLSNEWTIVPELGNGVEVFMYDSGRHGRDWFSSAPADIQKNKHPDRHLSKNQPGSAGFSLFLISLKLIVIM